MKEYIKLFETLSSADGYEINDVPFTSTIIPETTGGAPINLRCLDEGAKLEVSSGGTISIFCDYEFTGTGSWNQSLNWKDGKVPSDKHKNNIIVKGDMTINSIVHAHNFTIDSGYTVEIQDGGILYIDGVSETQEGYGNIDAKEGGKLVIKQTGSLAVNNLIINALIFAPGLWNGNSCEIFGAERILINGDCYFDVDFEPNGYVHDNWYYICVPFEVNANNGIYGNSGNGYVKYTFNSDYAVGEWNTNHKPKAYNGIMYPGIGYYFGLDGAVPYQHIRFIWTKNGSIYNSGIHSLCTIAENNDKRKIIGNNLLCKAVIDNINGIDDAKALINESNSYVHIPLSTEFYIGSCACWFTNENTQSKTITWVPVNNLLEE